MIKAIMTIFIIGLNSIASVLHGQVAIPVFQAVNAQDNNGPRITITATDGSNSVASGSLTNDANLSITFTANEVVTGFAVSDVGVTGGSLSSFSEVKIRFSENVYDTGTGSGVLETGDFTLSISGGSATLGSSNPTAVTKDTPTFSSRTIDNNLDGAWGLIIEDLDSDGDKDIIAAGYIGNDLNWYENDGSANFTERAIDLNLSGVLGLAVNDIDGDGDLDIFTTAKDIDQVALYTNNGSQSFTKSLISSDLDGPHTVGCNDLDDDGYMDVIVSAEPNNKVVWYKNDGSQNL